jgi:glycosyltransferase involved in cell wall biosynthesis
VPTSAPGEGRRLRIAHLNDVAAVGSVLARAMTELGEDAVVIAPRRFAPGLRYPWRVATLPFRGAALLGAAASVRLGHFDVVHVHYARFGFLGPLAGRGYALHVHGTDIRGVRPASWWARETGPFIRRARLVYYATPDLEEWVRPFRADATFLPNPIDTDLFRPLAAGDPARLARRDLLVGVRLAPVKGLPTILEILRLLAAERPATTVTIVAQGEGLVAVRAAAGPNAEVAARVPRDRLPELLRGHRLALGQFLVGAAGNYELEALASGVPVVMRFDHQDAYPSPMPVVNVPDARQAVTRICQLLDGGQQLDELAGRGPAWVEANHAARTVAARVLADYRAAGLDPR